MQSGQTDCSFLTKQPTAGGGLGDHKTAEARNHV